MTDFAGKVAIVTGAARGQGREMALELARAGADIAICDVGQAAMPSVGYALGGDLAEVAGQIEAIERRVVHAVCDVRDPTQVARSRPHLAALTYWSTMWAS
jgi:NAD(P)-dependent dehydrogenase (short-subunit alcohol dehydrogenase family)